MRAGLHGLGDIVTGLSALDRLAIARVRWSVPAVTLRSDLGGWFFMRVAQLEFVSDFWMNLHHVLYGASAGRSTARFA